MEPLVDRPSPTPPRGWRVRRADPGDLTGIESLLREIMAEHGVPAPPAAALRATIGQILAESRPPAGLPQGPAPTDAPPETVTSDREHLFLVVEHRGDVVGMCALLFSLSTWSATRVCELQDVVVSAPHRGLGLGRALLETAAAAARSRGCTRLFLTAEAINLPAHHFYRALGFDEKTVLYFERPA